MRGQGGFQSDMGFHGVLLRRGKDCLQECRSVGHTTCEWLRRLCIRNETMVAGVRLKLMDAIRALSSSRASEIDPDVLSGEEESRSSLFTAQTMTREFLTKRELITDLTEEPASAWVTWTVPTRQSP